MLTLALLVMTCAPTPQTQAPTKAPPRASLEPGAIAPALLVERYLSAPPVKRLEPGRIQVVHFFGAHLPPRRGLGATYPYLHSVYGARARFTGVVDNSELQGFEKAKAELDRDPTLFEFPIAWDESGHLRHTFVQEAGVSEWPVTFVIDEERRLAYVGPPGFVAGVLGDLAAGRWRAKECRAVVSEAQRLLIDLREHPAPETRLEKLAAFVERRGLGDAFAWDRFWTNLRIERFSDAAGDARAVIELASALRDAPKLRDAAWLLIAPTTPEDKRDADLALRAARVAVELTAGEDGDQLDVLARCFVAKGQCQEAIQLFLRALEKVEPEARPEIEQALRDCGYTITR